MKRRWARSLAGLAVAVGALMLWVLLPVQGPADPVYQGKKLSAWLEAAGSTNVNLAVEARFAIGRLGSNAVPYMIHQLKRESLKLLWLQQADRLFHTGTKFERMREPRMLAVRRGLIGLGRAVEPELQTVMEESSNDELLYEAYSAAEKIVSIQSDSRFSAIFLSSNAVDKVTAAVSKHAGSKVVLYAVSPSGK